MRSTVQKNKEEIEGLLKDNEAMYGDIVKMQKEL